MAAFAWNSPATIQQRIGTSSASGLYDHLTHREVQVLRLMADGLSTKTIAKELGIAFKTAACHRYRILDKIGVDNTVSAVRWAIRNGIVVP